MYCTQKSNPLVSIVIATSSRYKLLERMLESVKNQSFQNFEVILVCIRIDKRLKEMSLKYGTRLFEDKGLGRCVARNLGIHKSLGKIIVFLDDDIQLGTRWLELVVEGFLKPEVGGVGGIPCKENSGIEYFVSYIRGALLDKHSWGECAVRGVEYRARVDWLSGSNMAFRSDILSKIGGFDENFYGPSTGEDIDLCLRVRHFGINLIIDPRLRVLHNSNYVLRALAKHRHELRFFVALGDNRTYCMIKNGAFERLPSLLVFLFSEVFAAFLWIIRTSSLNTFFAYLKGSIMGYKRARTYKHSNSSQIRKENQR